RLDKLLKSRNGEASASLPRLKTLVRDKIAELRETVDLRKAQHLAPAMDIVLSDRGERAMGEIRNICFNVRRQISSERTSVQARTLAATRSSFVVTTLGSLFLIGLILTGYLLMRKQTRDRDEALAGIRGIYELGTRIALERDLRSLLGEILSAAETIT